MMHPENDTQLIIPQYQYFYSVFPHRGVINNDAGTSTITDQGTVEHKASNQAVSVVTAGIRAIAYQIQSLYLRSPVKLFRPSRFDYMAYVRALADRHNNINDKPYKFRTHSSIGMLVSVLRKEGWKFIPDQVMPPLIANSATGVILYATYLNTLDRLTSKRGNHHNTEYNWYSPIDTWRAGFVAGAVQSLAAAPVDAIYTRSSVSEMIEGSHENLWKFGINKLKQIGLVGVFAGYSFSLIKESFGFACYFSTFETIKTQGYTITYRIFKFFRDQEDMIKRKLQSLFNWDELKVDEKMQRLERYRSERILKTSFILIAGASAAFALLAVQYPLTKIQKIHLSRLEALDIYSESTRKHKPFVKLYYNSYIDTFNQVLRMKHKAKVTWFKAAYSGFFRNAVTTIPATSVALLVFEITRTRLVSSMEEPDILTP
ncbi:hypothetical protein KGF57_000273 [Candida theae]|uniref:Mitochondrial thiamine pyrophosphate carrier 1 n=1 Tax=Candida theae TaxID=1198502 RepID=A0AAD5BJ77_9ASCO|nr:uncharacterized protein KGF57_000273 [Candida theae]KAI5967845.1 hypothetical protein KGF57_000273 [Candida theae]